MLRDWHYPNPNHCHLCGFATDCLARQDSLGKDLIAEANQLLIELDFTESY
jgi:hypothetical protein